MQEQAAQIVKNLDEPSGEPFGKPFGKPSANPSHEAQRGGLVPKAPAIRQAARAIHGFRYGARPSSRSARGVGLPNAVERRQAERVWLRACDRSGGRPRSSDAKH